MLVQQYTPTESSQRGKTPRKSVLDMAGEAPVTLELWVTRSIPSLPSLPGPFWLGVVAPDRVLCIGQIEVNYILMLNWIFWNRTVFDIQTLLWYQTELFEVELFRYLNCVLILIWILWNKAIFIFNCANKRL